MPVSPSLAGSASVCIVKAGWHKEIVAAFTRSCCEQLEASGRDLRIQSFEVPGVVEIPLMTKKLIDRGVADIVIVVGLIADHGVYRHDFVAASVMEHVMQTQMETGVPVIYGILTPQDFMSEGREAFFLEHFVTKGVEAANACLKTLDNEQMLTTLCPVASAG